MAKYIIPFLFISFPLIGQTQIKNQRIPNDNLMKTEIDSVIQKEAFSFMNQEARVGLSIGIIKGDNTFFYNYGSTKKDKQILPTNKTIYEIGSITKTFTGTLLAQAVKDKKVKIDDDIRLYIDGSYPNLEYQGHPIKLLHLVSHISGLPFLLPDNPKLFEGNPDSIPYVVTKTQNNYSKRKFFSDLHKVKLDTIPGFDYHYSNSSAQLLKFILEKIYKKSYDKLLKEFFCTPLGMNNTTSAFKNVNKKYLVTSYNSKGIEMPYNPKILEGAGGIYSTTSDMLKYLKFHMNEENEVIALSHKVTLGDINDRAIGLNWNERKVSGYKKISQSGGTFGFSTYCVVYPELNIGIVILTNEADRKAQPQLNEMADKIFEKLIN